METTELLQKIADDVKTIAHGELELVAHEVSDAAKTAATEAVGVLFGGIVALIGFGMLCVAGVIVLEPVIGSLALRLLVMAVIYGVAGGVLATIFAKRLRRGIVPNLAIPGHEARAAIDGVSEAINKEPAHA